MPRNSKCRKICSEFLHKEFIPADHKISEMVTLNVDELEAIRLSDLEGLEQEIASIRMEVSRGTYQRILYSGRKKIAEALCGGKGISIGGGNYEVCEQCCPIKNNCKRMGKCKKENVD